MSGRLERIDREIARAIAADHDAELHYIRTGQDGVRDWLVLEICGLQDIRAALHNLNERQP